MNKMEQSQRRMIRVMREIENLVTWTRVGRNEVALPREERVMGNHKHCHQVAEVVGKVWIHCPHGWWWPGREELIFTLPWLSRSYLV